MVTDEDLALASYNLTLNSEWVSLHKRIFLLRKSLSPADLLTALELHKELSILSNDVYESYNTLSNYIKQLKPNEITTTILSSLF